MKSSDKLLLAAHRSNIPLTLILELTRDCNLACRHCYIPSADRRIKGLPTEKIKKILLDCSRRGAMYVVFTGGEPFLRPDIFELTAYAKKLAYDVRIFTNAALIDSAVAARIADSGVSAVEISIYGDAGTHDSITGKKGSFAAASAAADALLARGVRVLVKSPLMKPNFSRVSRIQKFAAARNIICRFDPTLAPADDGAKANLALRLDGRRLESVYRRFGHQIPSSCLANVPPHRAAARRRERLIECSAGRALAAVSADGELYPCPQLRISAGSLLKKDFGVLWRGPVMRRLRDMPLPPDSDCFGCVHLVYCQRCPGLALVEHGDVSAPPSEACRLSAIRRRVAGFPIEPRRAL